ncbi:sensor histidine kinase [Alkalihalobacillus hemicellulosilyticus]|uniref:histidine kinase n=1 Tax=Halalkalibacter hemicellulosilyticusJCM 9152 TaxID=1236971 RepID=W4QES7_9BACI|nr:ATP-binding protein [Halalkalibacter hemicellulosilyticus]GAE30600.1 two-component sensor histidine kinase [Halalkalibacter hemicellulosilyticusJCM 9152]
MNKLLNRMTFRTKILSALLIITLVLSGLSLLLVQSIKDVNQVSLELRDQGVPAVILLSHWERELFNKEQLIYETLSADSCCDIVDQYNEIMTSNQLEINLADVPDSLRTLAREMDLLDFLIRNELQGFLNFDDMESAERFLEETYLEELHYLQDEVDLHQVINYQEVQNKSMEFTHIIETSLALLTIVTIIAIIASIYISYRISNGLTLPMELLIKKVNRIAYGQYGLTFQNTNNQVELDELTNSINQMSLKLKESFETIINDKQYREQIVNSLPIGMMTIDHESSQISLNKAAQRLLGEEARFLADVSSIPNTSRNKKFWDILKSEKVCENRKVSFENGKEQRFFLVSQSILHDVEGVMIGRIFHFNDITETEQLEQRIHQSEKLAVIGEMAAGAAHEIRNPLAVIHGFLLLMNQSLSSEEQIQYRMPLLMKELERINFIIEEMLLLAKPSAPHFKTCFLDDVINEIIPLMKQKIESENVNIDVDLQRVPLELDAKQIKQVFYNLIRNSSESMNNQGTIHIYSEINEGQYDIYIVDYGCGIPKENQPYIFEPFSTFKENGTGLGLTIVKRIIQNHHGDIELQSSSEKGTTFRVRFPMKEG